MHSEVTIPSAVHYKENTQWVLHLKMPCLRIFEFTSHTCERLIFDEKGTKTKRHDVGKHELNISNESRCGVTMLGKILEDFYQVHTNAIVPPHD